MEITGPALVNEDSVVFKQPCLYSVCTLGSVLAWRCTPADAYQFLHREVIKNLKLQSLTKYALFFR
jgi:hypothetical protein